MCLKTAGLNNYEGANNSGESNAILYTLITISIVYML